MKISHVLSKVHCACMKYNKNIRLYIKIYTLTNCLAIIESNACTYKAVYQNFKVVDCAIYGVFDDIQRDNMIT